MFFLGKWVFHSLFEMFPVTIILGRVSEIEALKPLKSTLSFFEHSVKNRATFQRPATHARNIVYAYD